MYSLTDIDASVRYMDARYGLIGFKGLDAMCMSFQDWVRDEQNVGEIVSRVNSLINEASHEQVAVSMAWVTQTWKASSIV
jgi:hypothetical protein